MPRHLLVLASLFLGTAAFMMGCSAGNNGGNTTATSTFEATEVATVPPETPTPAPDIRLEDVTQQPGLRDFLSTAGGEVIPTSILYADVTDDRVDDAIVPVSSGGEGGNIGLFVYGYQPLGIVELLRVQPEIRLQAVVDDGQVIVTEPVYGPGDPFGFPSQLAVTTYDWNGTALAVVDRETKPSDGGQKP